MNCIMTPEEVEISHNMLLNYCSSEKWPLIFWFVSSGLLFCPVCSPCLNTSNKNDRCCSLNVNFDITGSIPSLERGSHIHSL